MVLNPFDLPFLTGNRPPMVNPEVEGKLPMQSYPVDVSPRSLLLNQALQQGMGGPMGGSNYVPDMNPPIEAPPYSDEAKKRALSQALMAAGFTMMSQGPTPYKPTWGEGIGKAGLAGLGAYNQKLNEDLKNAQYQQLINQKLSTGKEYTQTVKMQGPDGRTYLYGYNPATDKYDRQLGLSPEHIDNMRDYTQTQKMQGPDGKTHVFGYNPDTKRYDIDQGLAPEDKPLSKTIPGVGDITAMRKEFESDPVVKDYKTIGQQFKRVKSAYGMIGKNNVAVDQALITILNKMLDPTSVVRESEYMRTPENLSFINNIKGRLEKYGAGGAGLTDEDRKALLDMTTAFAHDAQSTYKDFEQTYTELATRNGINPKDIITTPKFDFGKRPQGNNPTPEKVKMSAKTLERLAKFKQANPNIPDDVLLKKIREKYGDN